MPNNTIQLGTQEKESKWENRLATFLIFIAVGISLNEIYFESRFFFTEENYALIMVYKWYEFGFMVIILGLLKRKKILAGLKFIFSPWYWEPFTEEEWKDHLLKIEDLHIRVICFNLKLQNPIPVFCKDCEEYLYLTEIISASQIDEKGLKFVYEMTGKCECEGHTSVHQTIEIK